LENPIDLVNAVKNELVTISIFYAASDLVEEDILKKECEKNGLKVSFLTKELKSVFQVSAIAYIKGTIFDLLDEIKKRLKKPFEIALAKKDLKQKIIGTLKNTDFLKSFIKVARGIHKKLKLGIESEERIRKELLNKHKGSLGEIGINLIIKIFKSDLDENIIDSYGTFQDFIIKQFTLELFIVQQIEQAFLVIITVDESVLIQKDEKFKINISNLYELEFKKIDWKLIGFHKAVEVYANEEYEHLILFKRQKFRDTGRDFYIYLKLILLNATSGLRVMDYSLDKEEEIFVKETEELPINLSIFRNNLRNYNSKELKAVRQELMDLLDTDSFYVRDVLEESKKSLQKHFIKQRYYDKKMIDTFFSRQLIDHKGMVYAVQKQYRPPALKLDLPSKLINKIYLKLRNKTKCHLRIQKSLRELIDEIDGLVHTKKLMEKESQLADEKIKNVKEEKVLKRFETLNKMITDVINILSRK